MATYLNTHGGRIQNYTTDPDNTNNGEVWYNSTSNVIKMEATVLAGSWATGGNMNNGRFDIATFGILTAALAAGGGDTGPPTGGQDTELYNGTNWTEVNNLNTSRYSLRGAGASSSSGIAFGGYGPAGTGNPNLNVTEQWNGTNWTSVNNMNQSAQVRGPAGIVTAALAIGGGGPSGSIANTEQWNGTNWTEVGDLNAAAAGQGAFGTTTAALSTSSGGTVTGATESYNGTNWTEVNDLTTSRRSLGAFGTQTSGLAFGGETPSTASVDLTEEWNGTNWTEVADMTVALRTVGGASYNTGNSSGLSIGGITNAGNASNIALEWTGAGPSVKTISTD